MSATDSGNLSPPDPKRRRTRKPAKHTVQTKDDFTEPYNMDMESGKKRLEEVKQRRLTNLLITPLTRARSTPSSQPPVTAS